MGARKYSDETIDRIVDQLEAGQSLTTICSEPGMPDRSTVWRWGKGDDALAHRIRDAWELGFLCEGERIYHEVLTCEDPHKGKVMLDAAKWHLGHRSQAYSEKRVGGITVNVGSDDALAAISGVLDRAAAAIASRSVSTQPVVIDGKARSGDADRRLADLAGVGGQGVGQDEDGG